MVPVVEIERLLVEPTEFFPELPDGDGLYFTDPWFDESTRCLVYQMRALLVVSRERTMLVDGCIRSGKRRRRRAFDDLDGQWWDRLVATGVAPDDINDVIFTHLHVDHVGWATRASEEGRWMPAFPRARHLVDSAELAHWSSRRGREAMSRTGDYMTDSVEPLLSAGVVEALEPPFAVSDRVTVEPASGHTPGNCTVRVHGSEADLWIVGDVMHHPLQLVDPATSTRYCVDPAMAARTRRRILMAASESEIVMATSHFAGDGPFHVHRSGTGYAMEAATEVIRHDDFDLSRWGRGWTAPAQRDPGERVHAVPVRATRPAILTVTPATTCTRQVLQVWRCHDFLDELRRRDACSVLVQSQEGYPRSVAVLRRWCSRRVVAGLRGWSDGLMTPMSLLMPQSTTSSGRSLVSVSSTVRGTIPM